jgi:hypothetical protein
MLIWQQDAEKGGTMVDQPTTSRTVKAGSITYFLDLKTTKEGKPFLVITESKFKSGSQERERISIAIFPEQAKDFANALQELLMKLA